jgi:glycosyltransferase involved in cell wall biosynthesis
MFRSPAKESAMEHGCKPSIYLYPITPYTYTAGANDYIIKKSNCLSEEFEIINSETSLGVLDILLKFFKTDILYFNWIEDLADKSFGYLQVALLFFILLASRLSGKKVIWFVHNNISHYPKNKWLKKVVRNMMTIFADKIFTHSRQLDIYHKIPNISAFDHPMEMNEFITDAPEQEFDVLIWGNQSPYKGTNDLLRYNKQNKDLQKIKFMIAGSFSPASCYEEIEKLKAPNIQVINRVIDDNELLQLFGKSKYVLFCYKKDSVLSSAALCRTLSYGKTVIGPNVGAFKELGEKGLVYTYENFDELTHKLQACLAENAQIEQARISEYIKGTGWNNFKEFLITGIMDTSPRRRISFKRAIA